MNGEVGSTSPVLGTRFATTAQQHLRILKQYRRIAMVGLSANAYRPSHFAALYMKAAGYQIFPVNPREREILGRKCYATLAELPAPLEIVDIFRESSAVPAIVEEAIAAGAKVIWMQQGIVHNEAAAKAKAAGLAVIQNKCIYQEHQNIGSI